MELVSNLLQFIVTLLGFSLSGIRYLKSRKQAYFLETWARRKILCKRYSTKVKNGAGKQGEFWPKSLVYRKPWRSERYARRHGVNAGLAVVAY